MSGHDQRRSAAPAPPASVLVGRDSEMAVLTGLIEDVVRGRGGAVLIEGEPGIGKSALVRAAVARARDSGCQVYWGAGDELGQALPLLPFLDGLRVREPSADPRLAAIARLLRGEAGQDRGTDVPAMLAEQLLALVNSQCAVRPVILVVDDLQWADHASITLWRRLARSASQIRLLLIGMARPVPQRDDLLALRRGVGAPPRLQIAALTEEAAAELAAALAGGRPGDTLLGLVAGAAGNPLYITELVAALARGASLTVTGTGNAELAGGSPPGSLSAAIADRLGFVSGPAREVLQAAALLGVDFAVADLAVMLDRGVADLLPAIDEARAAGVLADSGGSLAFRHPLLRAALYDAIPAPVRTAMHRDAGHALAAAGAPADRVARQLLQATVGPAGPTGPDGAAGPAGPDGAAGPVDAWLLDWLARSADQLLCQAPGVAAQLLARAADSFSADPARHTWLASRLADALYRTGDTAQAEQVAQRALEHAAELGPDVLVDLHWTLAQCRVIAGSPGESLATLDQALAAPGLAAKHRARLLVLAARTRFTLGEADPADRAAADALQAASEAGDTWAMTWALHVRALVAMTRGQLTEALSLFDRTLTVTQADPALADVRLLLQINKAATLGNLNRYEQAFAAARQARRLAGQAGTAIRLAQANGVLGTLLFETGRWDDALTQTAALPESLKEPAWTCCELGMAAVIGFHRGEAAAARQHLADVTPYAQRVGHRLLPPLELARSMEREQDGALPEALAVLTAWFDGNTEELGQAEDLIADAVRLAVQTGDLATAASITDQAGALADGSEIPHRQANALYCRGLVGHDGQQLLAAAARYGNAGRPLLAAKALEAAAVEFLSADDRERARDAFTRATEVYDSLGATADISRLQAVRLARHA